MLNYIAIYLCFGAVMWIVTSYWTMPLFDNWVHTGLPEHRTTRVWIAWVSNVSIVLAWPVVAMRWAASVAIGVYRGLKS
jgi:hypothetical protein